MHTYRWLYALSSSNHVRGIHNGKGLVRCLIFTTNYLVKSIWYQALGTMPLVPGTSCTKYLLVPGAW